MALQLLTTDQVAELLAIKPHTLRLWRMQGNGPAFLKIGGHVRYKSAVVESWIDAQARISTSQKAAPRDALIA
jgi:DNA-binding transcriptional MerR regulator